MFTEIVSNHLKICLIGEALVFAVSHPPISLTLQCASASLQVSFGISFDTELEAGSMSTLASMSALGSSTGQAVMRYCWGLNTLHGMDGCPSHLSFEEGVQCPKMAIILFMWAQTPLKGVSVSPGSILQNSTCLATDMQSFSLPSLKAQTNLSKVGTQV